MSKMQHDMIKHIKLTAPSLLCIIMKHIKLTKFAKSNRNQKEIPNIRTARELKDQGVGWRRRAGVGGSGKKEKDQWREESAWSYSAKDWPTFQICPIVPH